jgi:acyl phosphate:glycerol-3-phosphate acyltransferase
MSDAAIVLGAFIIGAIPFAFLLGKVLGGVDIRKVGSGNVGATNLARTLGLGKGIAGLLLDAAKGVAAVLIARFAAGSGGGSLLELLAGGASILGHMYTPFLGFRGGKGVATGAGVFGALSPAALLVAIAVFILALALTRIVSLASMLAALSLPIAVILVHGGGSTALAALLIGALVIARHRENLVRIVHGDEARLGSPPRGVAP